MLVPPEPRKCLITHLMNPFLAHCVIMLPFSVSLHKQLKQKTDEHIRNKRELPDS